MISPLNMQSTTSLVEAVAKELDVHLADKLQPELNALIENETLVVEFGRLTAVQVLGVSGGVEFRQSVTLRLHPRFEKLESENKELRERLEHLSLAFKDISADSVKEGK